MSKFIKEGEETTDAGIIMIFSTAWAKIPLD